MTRKQWIRGGDGQATVEFALVLPMLLMLLIGIVQLGVVLHDYLSLTDGVRVGAREAAVSRTAPDPVQVARQAVIDAAALDPQKLVVNAYGTWLPGTKVRVVGEYPYAVKLFGLPLRQGRLRSETVVRVE